MMRTLSVLALALSLAGCGGSSGAAATRHTYRDVTAGAVPGAASMGTSGGGTYVGGSRSFNGMAGGPISAENWDPSCRGWVPEAPQIQFDLPGYANMVLSAYSDVDITMVMMTPSGAILCNDDTNGLNPELSGEFQAGHYRVFIGTYSQGNSGTFNAELQPR